MKNFRFVKLKNYLSVSNACVLDVGAGSHSASQTKTYFPDCIYHGIDRRKDYANDTADFELMDAFFEMDVEKLEFDALKDDFYDVIIMSHIIEHLKNGDAVIKALLPKLKTGGVIYIEFPSFRSTRLPSMRETLNFFDDETHCRIYSLRELYNLLMLYGMTIEQGGIRRQWRNVFLTPFKMILQFVTKGYVRAGVFWDIAGFADFLIAKKH